MDSKSIEPKLVETKSIETKSVETKLIESTLIETKPDETKSVEPKDNETKPVDQENKTVKVEQESVQVAPTAVRIEQKKPEEPKQTIEMKSNEETVQKPQSQPTLPVSKEVEKGKAVNTEIQPTENKTEEDRVVNGHEDTKSAFNSGK